MMLLEIALVEPTGAKHNFQPGASIPSGMPTFCRDNLDHVNEMDKRFLAGFTEPNTQRPAP